jgi:hypothetical protein
MLEQALLISGDNHVELEKVLNHYANEPLKLKAAEFLISNMLRHVSYQNQKYVERYYNEIDSVNQYVDSNDELDDYYKSVIDKYAELPAVIPDLWIVSADYLIDNIDRAFDDWQNGLWAKHLSFEEFCEYLLPYKVTEYQSLDNWREYLSVPAYGDMRYLPYSAHSSHSAYWACYTVHQKLYELYFPKTADIPLRYPIRRMLLCCTIR